MKAILKIVVVLPGVLFVVMGVRWLVAPPGIAPEFGFVLADGMGLFQVRFYDGTDWLTEWTEEQQQLPKVIEVALATMPETGAKPFSTSFIVKPVVPSQRGSMDMDQMEGASNSDGFNPQTMDSGR